MLTRAGFGVDDSLHTLHVLTSYVVGLTLLQYGLETEQMPVVDYEGLADRYPHLARIGPALERYDEEREFEFGVDLLVAGLKAKKRRAGVSTSAIIGLP